MEILVCVSIVTYIILVIFLAIVTFMSFLTKLDSEKLEKSFVTLFYATPFVILTFLAFLFPNEMINLLKIVTFIGPTAITTFFIIVFVIKLLEDKMGHGRIVGGQLYEDCGHILRLTGVLLFLHLFSIIFLAILSEMNSSEIILASFSEIFSASFSELMAWNFPVIIFWLGFWVVRLKQNCNFKLEYQKCTQGKTNKHI